jgi:gas vesicle protein
MNETGQGKHDSGSLAPIIGFALGALVGGGIALLLAPASGARTRQRLGSAARRLGRGARRNFDEVRDSVTEAASGLGVDVKSAIDAGRKAFRHEGETLESPAPRPNVTPLSPPSARTP